MTLFPRLNMLIRGHYLCVLMQIKKNFSINPGEFYENVFKVRFEDLKKYKAVARYFLKGHLINSNQKIDKLYFMAA